MKDARLILSLLVLVAASVFALSCGRSSSSSHRLQSITLTPATADAQDFPNGMVQFTATGQYDTPPMAVTPLSATWGVCASQFQPTNEVSVTNTGVAHCASGAVGTYTVWANDPADLPPGFYTCTAETACGGGCVIQASAQLTCP